MFADESLGRFIHRMEVQWRRHQPRIAIVESRTSIAVEHAIFICAQARVAARIEIVAHRGGFDYRDVGRQQCVHRPLEFVRWEGAWKVECGHLAECMHARVGTARTVYAYMA